MSVLVFDAGALIALERNDRALWSVLRLAAVRSDDVLVPSAALAQVWRGTRAQAMLSRALQQCLVASFDAIAKPVGELCGRIKTIDICDAQVAIVAGTRGDVLYTSDPHDRQRLIAAFGRRMPTIVRC